MFAGRLLKRQRTTEHEPDVRTKVEIGCKEEEKGMIFLSFQVYYLWGFFGGVRGGKL